MTSIEIDRRTVLVAGALGAGTLAVGGRSAAAATGYFHHGVASGDPHPRSVILWTRVTPTPAATPGSGEGPRVVVRWQVATDHAFEHVAAQGTFTTDASRDHTVKLEATGLAPATTYFYRFVLKGQASPVGRTRTAPAAGADGRPGVRSR